MSYEVVISSGKTSITSTIKDALVINCDRKPYSHSIPHATYQEWNGVNDFTNFINEKIKAYKEKFGGLPKYLVIDTITQLYAEMVRYNNNKYTGFAIHNQNNKDTLDLNKYFESIILANGINLVIVAHTTYDADTAAHTIPAQGDFKRTGSWLSVVDNSIFISKTGNKLQVYLSSFKYPARTTLADMPEKVDIKDYNITEHLAKFEEKQTAIDEFRL
ncbi:MAG: hypothetical protein KGV43_02915 [Arcobacter sp.]|nr:hypothetical protein [Arcobacter sp.]